MNTCTGTSAARQYLSEITSSLTCPKTLKQKVLKSVSAEVDEFFIDNPDASYDDLKNSLGNPNEIAISYIESLDPEEIQKELKKVKRNKWIVIVSCVLALFLLVGTFCFIIHDNKKSQIGIEVVSVSASET